MTSKQINSLKAVWQKRLRIQDWDIEVRIVGIPEMMDVSGSDDLGLCITQMSKKKARIFVRRAEDIEPHEDDQEIILVHELLHVVMPMQDLKLKADLNDSAYVAYERIIDQMARMLVGVHRGKN